MAVSVVRGVASKATTDVQQNPRQQGVRGEQVTHAAPLPVSSQVVNDAIVNSVRAVTRAPVIDRQRIESFHDAQELADEVADRVRDGGSDSSGGQGLQAHAVSSNSARQSL